MGKKFLPLAITSRAGAKFSTEFNSSSKLSAINRMFSVTCFRLETVYTKASALVKL